MRALQYYGQISRVLMTDTSRLSELKKHPVTRDDMLQYRLQVTADKRFPRAASKLSRRHCYMGCMAKLVDSFLNNYS